MRRFLTLLAVLMVLLTSATSFADVILHPGTVTGNSGLTSWNFGSGGVYLSQNVGNGFSGSTTISGGQGALYSLTVEGDQTYASLGQSLSMSGSSTYFSMSRQVSLYVPVGGTAANQDLLTPGGTIQVDFSATTAPGATATVQNAYFYANAANGAGTESYFGYTYSYGTTSVPVPMAATSNVTLYGNAYFSLTDTANNTCTVSGSINYGSVTVPAVTEGVTTVVNHTFDLSAMTCPTGVGTIHGMVTLNAMPPGLTPAAAYVCVSGPQSPCASITSNPFAYTFANLPIGSYRVYAYETFGSGSSSGSGLQLAPNGGQSYVYLAAGDDLQVDFTYDVAAVQGTFDITGPMAAKLAAAQANGYASASASFRPHPDPYGGPNYGNNVYTYIQGYGGNPLPALPAPYATAIPAGTWNMPSFSASAYTNTDSTSLSIYDPNATPFTVNGGDTQTLDIVVDTSQGDLVFDVAEQGGPSIGISYPYVSINAYDPLTGRSVYISAQSYALNQATPAVRVIGPPGQYSFTASAQVQGSYVTFPPGTITLGQGANTPAGTNQQVTLLDQNGNPTGVTLTFDNVTAAGQTTGSFVTQGPVPPGGFTLMPAFNGASYLSINTTATFTGNVLIAMQYNPASLGLTPQTEGLLQLWHYHCDASGNNCQWEYINGGASPNPDTVNHVIYGITPGFSVFALMLPTSCQSSPTLSLAASPSRLTPPNHKLVPINLSWTATDVCDPSPQVTCAVTSNQAPNGKGDGNTTGDILWNNGELWLRAERSGGSGDRVYTISCTAKNEGGKKTTKSTTVTVPHDGK